MLWEPEAEKAVAALGQDVTIFQDNRMYREFFSLYASTETLGNPKRRQELVAFVRALDTRPIRLALYHPLLGGWREWAYEDKAAVRRPPGK